MLLKMLKYYKEYLKIQRQEKFLILTIKNYIKTKKKSIYIKKIERFDWLYFSNTRFKNQAQSRCKFVQVKLAVKPALLFCRRNPKATLHPLFTCGRAIAFQSWSLENPCWLVRCQKRVLITCAENKQTKNHFKPRF